MSKPEYRLTIDETQARALIEMIDLATRIWSGQYEELGRLMALHATPADWGLWHSENDRLIISLKRLHYPALSGNSSYGIISEKVPLMARVAYDVHQVLRKQVAENEGADDWNVWRRSFMSTSQHPYVARVERIEETFEDALAARLGPETEAEWKAGRITRGELLARVPSHQATAP